MNRWRDKMRNFMSGRYGSDNLSRFLLSVSSILLVISMFVRSTLLLTIIMLILGWNLYRTMSRNYAARAAENQKYRAATNRLFGGFRNAKRNATDREHAYFTCPTCHQTVRVPRGKGAISIRCPKCHTDFIKRT